MSSYTKLQLLEMGDDQILSFFEPRFDKFIEWWPNSSNHPECLWDDGYYCEVVADLLTEEQKKEWFKSFTEDGYNEMEHPDFDTLLDEVDCLGEDIGQWWSEQPENRADFIVFSFKWMLENREKDLLEELNEGKDC
jgi:hypothetical protein